MAKNIERRSNWAKLPQMFGDNIAHTKAPNGKKARNDSEGPTPFWTYTEQDKNGQISMVKATRDFEVRLDPRQLDFVCYYNMILTNQLQDFSVIQKSDNVPELIEKLFGATNIFFDVSEFATMIGQNDKVTRKIVNECLDVFQDRIYHWFAKVKNPKTQQYHFFPYQTPLIIPHYEADAKTGRRIKNGQVVLEVPLTYVRAMIETGHYCYFPDWFFKIGGKNCQNKKYLALRCIERYFQNKGKNGEGYFTLETAMDNSGLFKVTTVTRTRADGSNYTATKTRNALESFAMFDGFVRDLIEQGGFDKEGTFFATDPNGEHKIDPRNIDPKKGAYFFFKLNDMHNYRPKVEKLKGKKDGKKPTTAPRRMGGGITQAGAIDPDAPENGA